MKLTVDGFYKVKPPNAAGNTEQPLRYGGKRKCGDRGMRHIFYGKHGQDVWVLDDEQVSRWVSEA